MWRKWYIIFFLVKQGGENYFKQEYTIFKMKNVKGTMP
jgi:hypothetical protein